MKTLNEMTAKELVAEFNKLSDTPINQWKQAKSILVEKIEALKAEQVSSEEVPSETIQSTAERLLRAVDFVGDDNRPVGYNYAHILACVKEAHPQSDTSNNCLRWYASKLRTNGEILPKRPRKKADRLAVTA